MFTSTCTCNQQIHVHVHENLYIIIDYRITDTKIYPSLKTSIHVHVNVCVNVQIMEPATIFIHYCWECVEQTCTCNNVQVQCIYMYTVCNTILVHVFGNETEHNALCTIVHTCT